MMATVMIMMAATMMALACVLHKEEEVEGSKTIPKR